MVGIGSAGDSFARRFGNPSTTLVAGRMLEEGKNLCQKSIIGRLYWPFTCASTASAWGSQKVMSMAW